MAPTIALAKFRGRTPSYPIHGGRILDTVYLDVPAIPTSPFRVGDEIHVYCLKTKPKNRNSPADDSKYEIHPTDIRGRIVGFRTMDSETTEMVMKNDDPLSTTEYAHMTVPHIHNVTTTLPIWLRIVRWLALKLGLLPMTTRRIPVERIAVTAETEM
ncbi:hypothetical protein ONZ51_g1807 [Trametes cubensis]|uniref:Uncharacterized protein n=1 Tax=Trametes cubensis TaxID=1111947 RepID=A0AAD7U0U5_9APHY|nr:hypothetical protein ONZ51_g1807 [Trametes cubensis]